MQVMRGVYAALLAAFVLAAAGCGSGEVGAAGPSPAEQLKPGALVYWEVSTDPDSDQWQQVQDLLNRFPDGDKLVARLRKMVTEEGVDWEQDVKPALGLTTALALYAGPGGRGPHAVGLTNSDDPDKTVALAKKLDAKGGGTTVTRVVGGWVALSDSEDAIDAALKGSGAALADDAGFKSAMDKLPDDALTRLYADPAAALEALGNQEPDVRRAFGMLGLDDLDFAGAWAKAKDSGAEAAFTLAGDGASRALGTGEPYASALLERVPEDAFAFISFQGGAATGQVERFRSNPLYQMGVQQLERELGITVEDLLALFSGESALYARPAVPIPEVTLLLDVDNVQDARATAERLLRNIAGRAGGEMTEDGDVTTATFYGVAVSVGSVEGMLVVTTSRRAFDELSESGNKLSDSDRFKSALDAAGTPDEYTGLAYVDLSEAIALIQGYLGVAGGADQVPPELGRNLEPLKSLVAWGTADGDSASGQAFLEID
jgi:Protein of unknown function (DUF3352)